MFSVFSIEDNLTFINVNVFTSTKHSDNTYIYVVTVLEYIFLFSLMSLEKPLFVSSKRGNYFC